MDIKNFVKVLSIIFFLSVCIKLQGQENYRYEEHADFKIFWNDFKKAVNVNDRNAVLKMTNIPFIDYYVGVQNINKLTSNTSKVFLQNYDNIFTSEIIAEISAERYISWSKEKEEINEKDEYGIEGFQIISEGEYLICSPNGYPDLIFKIHEGVYKLSFIPYYE